MKHLSKALAIALFLSFGLFTSLTSFPQALNAAPPGDPPIANVSPTFDDLTVTGRLNRNSVTVLGGVVSLPAGFTEAGSLYAGPKFSAGNVESRGNITMTSAAGNIINTAGTDINIADNLKVTGTTASTGDLSTGGNLNVTGTIYDTDDLSVNIGEDLLVAGSLYDTNDTIVNVGENLTVSGNISSTGSITATTGIGKFNKVYANANIAPGTNGATATCPAEDFLAGCAGNLSGYESVDRYLGTESNTARNCIAWAYNGSAAGDTDSVQAIAFCFSPNGN